MIDFDSHIFGNVTLIMVSQMKSLYSCYTCVMLTGWGEAVNHHYMELSDWRLECLLHKQTLSTTGIIFNDEITLGVVLNLDVPYTFYLFGVLRHFQHCAGHITTGSWKGRGN